MTKRYALLDLSRHHISYDAGAILNLPYRNTAAQAVRAVALFDERRA
jgi:hypothetical protein